MHLQVYFFYEIVLCSNIARKVANLVCIWACVYINHFFDMLSRLEIMWKMKSGMHLSL